MTVEAYAKVNLTLEVFGLRDDGYHALRSVVAPITLFDVIDADDAMSLASDVPYPDDLCLKAARVLDPTCGAALRVTKRIPVGGGLGGGSADAAATLLALNDLWGLFKTPAELAEIGAQVGSDVPALVLAQSCRRAVLMEGRGEQVRTVTAARDIDLVLLNPGVPSATGAVYAAVRPRAPCDSLATGNMLAALATGDVERIAASTCNDLEEAARALHPEIDDALCVLRDAGALAPRMSGSGSTVFGFVSSPEEAGRIAADLVSGGHRAWAVRTRMTDEWDGRV